MSQPEKAPAFRRGEHVTSCLRPNYRRARALALEIEALRQDLHEAEGESMDGVNLEKLKDELHDLEHEFFLTGVTSEYEL
jgi:hypothetical protein